MKPVICPVLFHATIRSGTETPDCAMCSVELCGQAERIIDSIRLIQLGARAGLVAQLTGLEKATVNRLYRQLCGTPSPSGQMPFTDAWYRECDRRMLHATIVWRLHERLRQTDRHASRGLIDVFEIYRQLVPQPLLDLTHTVFVPRLVAMGAWHEQSCAYCGTAYLAPVDSNSLACPGCRLYHRHRCHECGARLAAQPRGRRRVVCGECGNTDNGGTRQ